MIGTRLERSFTRWLHHPFLDGNKRTALAALVVALDRVDWRLQCSDDDIFEMVVKVASRKSPFDGSADAVVTKVVLWIKAHVAKKDPKLGGMKIRDFLSRCEAAGGRVKSAKTSWHVTGNVGAGVKISKATKRIDGNVVRAYLSKIGLSEAWTGMGLDEFASGEAYEQNLIRSMKSVMYRLAAYDREAS